MRPSMVLAAGHMCPAALTTKRQLSVDDGVRFDLQQVLRCDERRDGDQ